MTKDNLKNKVLDYLANHKSVSRIEVQEQLSISKSRLSEVLSELRQDGHAILTPPRSGKIIYETVEVTNEGFSKKDLRKWIILYLLAQCENTTGYSYKQLIHKHLSLYDSSYTSIDFTNLHDDGSMQRKIEEHFPNCDFSLYTLRTDIKELEKDKLISVNKGESFAYYSISASANTLYPIDINLLFSFIDDYQIINTSRTKSIALQNVYSKIKNIIGIFEETQTYSEQFGRITKLTDEQKTSLINFMSFDFNEKTLEITYQSKKYATTFNFDTGVFFYCDETSEFYLLGYNQSSQRIELRRLANVLNLKQLDSPNEHYNSADFLKKYDEMFSASYEDELYHVKVSFQSFGNIPEKLTELKKLRKNAKLYKENDRLIYEDDLRGLNSFSRYIRGFGSSAIVIEPQELREKQIESAKRILQLYEKENIWIQNSSKSE